MSVTKENRKNKKKNHPIKNIAKQNNKEGLGEVRWPKIPRKGPPHLNNRPKKKKKTNMRGRVK